MVLNISSQVLHFPLEIENAIFDDLGGYYEPDFDKVQQNLNACEKDLQAYLGTYFPRSFVEAYRIFEDLIYNKDIKNNFNTKNELFILDIGSGTGGNILGLLWIMRESFENFNHKRIHITSIDGNERALEYQELLVKRFFPKNTKIDAKRIILTKENITEKLKNVLIQEKFDIIMSSKFVNEFYRGEEFLFDWNEIPGNDSDRLIKFLNTNFDFTWVKESEIKITKNGDTICVSNKIDSLLIKLDTDEKNVIITNNGKIVERLIVKMDSVNLKIYKEKYTINKGMYKIITETVSKHLEKNGLFILSDVTDEIRTKLYLPHIMNYEILKYINSNNALAPILPLSCALWLKKCKANSCFTRRFFSIRFNDASKVNHKLIHKSGISYKVFTNKNTAERILGQIEKQDCYKISDGQTCKNGFFNCMDINSERQADAFSFEKPSRNKR